MESNKGLTVMTAETARERVDYLFGVRCNNLLVGIQKKIDQAIDACECSVSLTYEEHKYCHKKLIELGYEVTRDGIDW